MDIEEAMQRLRDMSADVRAEAARALGDAGPEAKAAVPALIASLRDDDDVVRYAIVSALGRIGDSSAVGPLARLRQDPSRLVRNAVAAALNGLGHPSAESSQP